MAVSEVERMELVGRLKDAIGENAAETLMACILPDGLDQLATKADLEVLGAGLRAELLATKADLEGLGAGLRAELLATKADLEVLGAGLHTEMAGLRSCVESALAKQARLYYGTLVVFLLSVWGVFLAQNFM